MSHTKSIYAAARLLRQADGLLITAGAGMGIDSGLPDFRGDQGFWKAYPALGKAGIRFTEIASPVAFHEAPRLGVLWAPAPAVPRHAAARGLLYPARDGRAHGAGQLRVHQ